MKSKLSKKIKDFLKTIENQNRASFGDRKLDCCDINKDKKKQKNCKVV